MDRVFFHWLLSSYEKYVWFRITNYLDQFIEGYGMNHSVNKLFYKLKDMDRDMHKTLSETVTILFLRERKPFGDDSQQTRLKWLLEREYIQRFISDYISFGRSSIMVIWTKQKYFLDFKKQLARRFAEACAEEKITLGTSYLYTDFCRAM